MRRHFSFSSVILRDEICLDLTSHLAGARKNR
jgi:hypothetical protein